jgi:hypothetical protein
MLYSTLCLTLLSATACDYSAANKPKSPPPFHATQGVPLSQVREIAKPIAGENTAFAENRSQVIEEMTYKANVLFSEVLVTDDDRFSRLEQAVQGLADKFIGLEPAIQRLTKIDRDLDQLTSQLEILLKSGDIPQSDAPIPSASEVTMNFNQAGAPLMQGSLQRIRISDHSDKIRIVMDSDAKLNVETLLSEGSNFIIQFLGNEDQGFDPAALRNTSAFISGVSQDLDNAELSFSLTRAIQNKTMGYIPPSSANSYHRTYIDLKL